MRATAPRRERCPSLGTVVPPAHGRDAQQHRCPTRVRAFGRTRREGLDATDGSRPGSPWAAGHVPAPARASRPLRMPPSVCKARSTGPHEQPCPVRLPAVPKIMEAPTGVARCKAASAKGYCCGLCRSLPLLLAKSREVKTHSQFAPSPMDGRVLTCISILCMSASSFGVQVQHLFEPQSPLCSASKHV